MTLTGIEVLYVSLVVVTGIPKFIHHGKINIHKGKDIIRQDHCKKRLNFLFAKEANVWEMFKALFWKSELVGRHLIILVYLKLQRSPTSHGCDVLWYSGGPQSVSFDSIDLNLVFAQSFKLSWIV